MNVNIGESGNESQTKLGKGKSVNCVPKCMFFTETHNANVEICLENTVSCLVDNCEVSSCRRSGDPV